MVPSRAFLPLSGPQIHVLWTAYVNIEAFREKPATQIFGKGRTPLNRCTHSTFHGCIRVKMERFGQDRHVPKEWAKPALSGNFAVKSRKVNLAETNFGPQKTCIASNVERQQDRR
jgi:hypothetical protein